MKITYPIMNFDLDNTWVYLMTLVYILVFIVIIKRHYTQNSTNSTV